MEPSSLLSVAGDDGRALVVAAETDWGRRVPHCPAWDAAGLVGHTGGILQWMAAVVTSGERVSRRTLPPPPEEPGDLSAWYRKRLEETLAVLGSADLDAETWTFSTIGNRRVAWWHRRVAVEVAIHRWDIQHAVALDGGAPPRPLDGLVASTGVEEFVSEFLPGLLAQDGAEGLGGTLHLHATDGSVDWWIDLDAAGSVLPWGVTADMVVAGTRSDLLLWLTNRGPLGTLEVAGNRTVADRWDRLQR
jgi:uncharacterized protein (TIGR03083 family)